MSLTQAKEVLKIAVRWCKLAPTFRTMLEKFPQSFHRQEGGIHRGK